MKQNRQLIANRPKGFTLVELITVIIILGILSVTAAPKFLNLQDDARDSVMKGIKGSMETVVKNVYLSSVLQGTDNTFDTTTDVSGVNIRTYYGYPQEIWQNHLALLMDNSFTFLGNAYSNTALLDQECDAQICVIEQIKLSTLISGASGYGLAFVPKGFAVKDACLVTYYFVASSSGPESTEVHINNLTQGCNPGVVTRIRAGLDL